MTINIEIYTHTYTHTNIVNVKQKAFIKKSEAGLYIHQYVKYSRQSYY